MGLVGACAGGCTLKPGALGSGVAQGSASIPNGDAIGRGGRAGQTAGLSRRSHSAGQCQPSSILPSLSSSIREPGRGRVGRKSSSLMAQASAQLVKFPVQQEDDAGAALGNLAPCLSVQPARGLAGGGSKGSGGTRPVLPAACHSSCRALYRARAISSESARLAMATQSAQSRKALVQRLDCHFRSCSSAERRASISTVSIARRLASRIAAVRLPSSGVSFASAHGVSTAPTAATHRGMADCRAAVSAISRDLRCRPTWDLAACPIAQRRSPCRRPGRPRTLVEIPRRIVHRNQLPRASSGG